MSEATQYGTITPLGPHQFLVVQPSTRPNHVLHLLLTLVTFGLWAIVWVVLAIDSRPERRHLVSVDEAGRVWVDNQLRTSGLGLK